MGPRRLSLKFKLYGMTILCAIGLLLVLGLSLWCLVTFRVDGPVYRNIVKDKDVVADVLPPPLFIIQAYLVLQETDDTTDPEEIKRLEGRFARLQTAYRSRFDFWNAELPDGELKTSLIQRSSVPAQEFFDVAQQSYFPAIDRGDRAAASSVLQNKLRNLYRAHRMEIEKTVALARVQTSQLETDATRRATFWMRVMITVSVISVAALALLILKMRAIEELIIRSEKMNTAAGLAAGMAHEINSPLAGVVQSAQVALNRVSPELEANCSAAVACGTRMEQIHDYLTRRGVREMLEGIRASGQRAAEVVATMLSFSRHEDGQLHETSFAELLDQTVELARTDFDPNRRYDFKNIDLVREYDNRLGPVPCRPGEIQQVVLNLLKNASQAMPDRGNRTDPPRITVRTIQSGNSVTIEVQDNGPGMPRGMRRRVFEPFFTTREAYGGTGLGLFVSYFIITRNHSGTINVDSTLGVGTKFSLTLPLVRKL